MSPLQNVDVLVPPVERVEAFVEWDRLVEAGRRAQRVLDGRTLWTISSTRHGGVAEMLFSVVAHSVSAGVDLRWVQADGDPAFSLVGKRLHHRLSGDPGDGGPLGSAEHAVFAATSATNAHALAMVVKPGDLIILNGPRVAGMAPLLRDTGALVLWRLRVGADPRNDAARQAWAFLLPYLDDAHAFQFTDWDVVPPELADRRVSVIQPAIDISMEKNVPMGPPQVASVLRAAGIIDGQSDAVPILTPHDGRVRAVTCRARMIQDEPIQFTDPLVVQIARWDALKDPVGVIQAFAAHIAPAVPDARLVLAGPSPDLVSDDPEGSGVLADATAARAACDEPVRRRIHLASLPADERMESAAMVNALQRHASVVVQKSLAEGFGLAAAEAMWKRRPVVASRVGGLRSLIDDGVNGILVDDPTDLAGFGTAVVALLEDPRRADALGDGAHERVRAQFLFSRYLQQMVQAFSRILDQDA